MAEELYVVVATTRNPLASGWPGDPTSRDSIVFGPASKQQCKSFKDDHTRYSDAGSPTSYAVKPARVTVEVAKS